MYSNFKIGQIYKMNVGSRSHVKRSYFVEIIDIGHDYIVTNIPGNGFHSLMIDETNYHYHIPRMKYIGEKSEYEYLLEQDKEDLYLEVGEFRNKKINELGI